MSCPSFETLSAYADREASPAETALLAAHAPACPACSRMLALIAAERRSLSALPVPSMPPDLTASLLALTARRPWWETLLSELRAGFAQPTGAVAAAALAVVAVLVWGRREPPPAAVAELEVPVEVLMAAHRRYALSMPLTPPESAPPPAQLQVAGLAAERDVY
ncbi:MAG: zf-HC2 domain-containing protein [Elusimicrobia bacterium]|nr:zf-HC2 domain-containing protein [Elusimicrobiota bacterium]